MDTFQIRDARAADRYYLDNELIDVYGKKIGAYGLAVYNVLARYANYKSQECYPSYKTIGEALEISRNAVIAAIKKLEDSGLISTEKRVSHEKGKPTTTSIYTLLAVEKVTTDKNHPSTSEVPGGLPSTLQVPPLVPDKNHPSTSEVPELNVINLTNSNQSSSMREIPALPVKKQEPTENAKIAAYFAKAISSHPDTLSPIDYQAINKIVAEGFTLDRAKPGIDDTVNSIRGRGEVVRSFKVCFKAIRQLDTANQPVSFQDFRERPKPVDPNAAERRAWAIKQAAEMGLTLASATA